MPVEKPHPASAERNLPFVGVGAVILLLGLFTQEAIGGEVDLWRLTVMATAIGIGAILILKFS